MHAVTLWLDCSLDQVVLLISLCYLENEFAQYFKHFIFQAFKPVVGKSLLSSVTAVEFLLDQQLDFLSDHSTFQPYQVMNIITHLTYDANMCYTLAKELFLQLIG